jgi:hypothetical protein
MSNPFSWWRMLYWRFRWFVFPRHRYDTRCQYCAMITGRTIHAWATEDVCDVCAAPLRQYYQDQEI